MTLPAQVFFFFLSNINVDLSHQINDEVKSLLQKGYNPDARSMGKKDNEADFQGISPSAYFIPCAAHSLNLIGEAAATCCGEAVAFFDLLQELYDFFSPTTRWEELY